MQFAAVADSIVEATRVVSALTRSGYDTTLRLHEHSDLLLESKSSALVLDANLRGLSRRDSRTRLERLGRKLRQSQIAFYRFDSSLRRPWDDLFATLEASGRRKLVLAAFSPPEGFEVRHGTVFWHGSPLHRSQLARDRHNPVYEANIVELLEREGLGAVALVHDINPANLRAALQKAKFIVVDGGNRSDAERLVQAVEDPTAVLWAGSPHLARAIGQAYCEPALENAQDPLGAPTLLALGTHPSSAEQIKALRLGGAQVVLLEPSEDGISRAVAEAERALRQGRGCVLQLESAPLFGFPASLMRQKLFNTLGTAILELSQRGSFEHLLLCGSSVTSHALRQLQATGIHANPYSNQPQLLAPKPHHIAIRASNDTPQTLLGAYQVLAG
ncbi:MAG: four-carbon acid sugar kinase family protein [Deinococcales bacterium]